MKQEINAAWTVYNMTSSAINQGKNENPIDQAKYKNEMDVNYGAAFAECLESLLAIYYTEDLDIKRGLQQQLKWKIRHKLVPYRPNRPSYPRDKKPLAKYGCARTNRL